MLVQYPMIGQSTPPNIKRTFEWVSEVCGEGFIRVHAELLRLNTDDNLKPTLKAVQDLGVELFDIRRNYHILFCSLRDRIRPIRDLMIFHNLFGRLESGHVHRILLKLDSSSLRELSGRLRTANEIFESESTRNSSTEEETTGGSRTFTTSETLDISEALPSQTRTSGASSEESLDTAFSEHTEATNTAPDPTDVLNVVREKDPWLYTQLGRDRSKLLRFGVPR